MVDKNLIEINCDFYIFWANGLRVIFRSMKTYLLGYFLLGDIKYIYWIHTRGKIIGLNEKGDKD